MKRKIMHAFITVVLTLLFLEIPLRIIDPWHLRGVYKTIDVRWREDGSYLPAPGDWTFETWTATVLPNGTRFVPDTRPSNCRLVTIGDSMTFGWGVDDDETWPNQLAKLFPDVEIINAGVYGYHSGHILARKHEFEADYFLWLMIPNDTQGEIDFVETFLYPSNVEPYVTAYLKRAVMMMEPYGKPPQTERFWNDLEAMTTDGDVLIFNLDVENVSDRYPQIPEVEWRVEPLSVFDSHPIADNYETLAHIMAPHVREIIEEHCD